MQTGTHRALSLQDIPEAPDRLGLTVHRPRIHPNKLSSQSVSLLLWVAGYANISPNVLPHLVSPHESPRPRVSVMSAEQESQYIEILHNTCFTNKRPIRSPKQSEGRWVLQDTGLSFSCLQISVCDNLVQTFACVQLSKGFKAMNTNEAS